MKLEKDIPRMIKNKVYHCALDDTIDVLEEISRKENSLESIFDVEVMGCLKQLHNKYGTKFSLYLFYEKPGFNLSEMTDKFYSEWQQNSSWLRLSFHARTKKPGVVDYYLYDKADYQTAKEDFQLIKKEILRFAGPESWDNFPRTHYWSGSRETVMAWRDCGVGGLFYSYPGFPAMYFDEVRLQELWQKDFWYDEETEMLYITTNVKLPGCTVSQVEKIMAGLENRKIIDIFCDDYNLLELQEQMEKAVSWASQHGYDPVFYDEVFK